MFHRGKDNETESLKRSRVILGGEHREGSIPRL